MKLAVLAALDQRIALRYTMPPMTAEHTATYITHHLKLAGRADTLFSDGAVALIHTTARGYPRAVNNLALQALVATYAAGKAIVNEQAAPRRRHRSHRHITPAPHPRPPAPPPSRPRSRPGCGAFLAPHIGITSAAFIGIFSDGQHRSQLRPLRRRVWRRRAPGNAVGRHPGTSCTGAAS